jgi:hypothetical protein
MVVPFILASIPASSLNQKLPDSGIPLRFRLKPSRSSVTSGAVSTIARACSRDTACRHCFRLSIGNKRVCHIGAGLRWQRNPHVPPAGEPPLRSTSRGALACAGRVMTSTNQEVGRLARQHERADTAGRKCCPCRQRARGSYRKRGLDALGDCEPSPPEHGMPKRTAPPPMGPNIALGFAIAALPEP